MFKFVVRQQRIWDNLLITFSDGTQIVHNLIELGCDWFRMCNDSFYRTYGFNFNPHEYSGIYERCKEIVHGGAVDE